MDKESAKLIAVLTRTLRQSLDMLVGLAPYDLDAVAAARRTQMTATEVLLTWSHLQTVLGRYPEQPVGLFGRVEGWTMDDQEEQTEEQPQGDAPDAAAQQRMRETLLARQRRDALRDERTKHMLGTPPERYKQGE